MIERWLRAAIAVFAMTTAGWGLFVLREKPAYEDYQSFTNALRRAIRADEDVNQQVLRASFGLSPHYDAVNESLVALREALDGLRLEPAFLDEEARDAIRSNVRAIDTERNIDDLDPPYPLKVRRVQRFEADHARLRAVQLYFPAVAGDLSEKLRARKDQVTSAAVEQIIREMLTYDILRDAHIADRIDAELNEISSFENRPSLADVRADLADVVRQASFITAAKPKVDGLTDWILRDRRLSDQLRAASRVFDDAYSSARERDLQRSQVLYVLLITTILLGATSIILTITRQREAIREEHERAETLLLNILPAPIAALLKSHPQDIIAENYADVTVLFADIVGFTPLASRMTPVELVGFLNRVFSAFDRLAAKHGLEKIKTLGDAYMVAGGLPERRLDHAEAIANMALDMQSEILRFRGDAGEGFGMRIGVNSGPVVAGVIGIKKFIYDLWGDAVNVASRMESHGIANGIHCSQSTWERLKDKGFLFEERGLIDVKGKGQMRTWILVGRQESGEEARESRIAGP